MFEKSFIGSGCTYLAASFAWILLAPTQVAAFKPKGHEELEYITYARLRQDKALPRLTFSGDHLLKTLVEMDVLQRQPDGKLMIGSGRPDASLERQFNSGNQAFHFMASSDDVVAAGRTDEPRCELLKRSLPANISLMRLLFDEVVRRPVGAFQAGRGTYVLMHMVGDSFSKEHVERDGENRLVTIKGWRLLRIFWPNAATEAVDRAQDDTPILALLHGGRGRADEDWKRRDSGELTNEGLRAVDALQELLVALYLSKKAWDRAPNPEPSVYEEVWKNFIRKNYANACDLEDIESTERAHAGDVDSFPALVIGAGPGWTFSGEASRLVGQLTIEGHVVPFRATGLWSRLMPGAAIVARMPITNRERIDSSDSWTRGAEATLVGGVSTQAPWIRWIGIYLGAGIRGGSALNAGPTATASWTYYLPRFAALNVRYEHNFWLAQSFSYEHTLTLNLSWQVYRHYRNPSE